jgi:SPP1 family predicted phage head-tail adaptor
MQPFKYTPRLNSGLFRQKITFQEYANTTDSDGFSVKDWVDVKTVWAMIKTLQGREYYQAAAVQAENTTRFVIRYTTGINNKMRIKYGERIFDIAAPPINDDEKNITLTIIANEVISNE